MLLKYTRVGNIYSTKTEQLSMGQLLKLICYQQYRLLKIGREIFNLT